MTSADSSRRSYLEAINENQKGHSEGALFLVCQIIAIIVDLWRTYEASSGYTVGVRFVCNHLI